MKKIAVIFILLIFSAVFLAGCSKQENGAYDLYTDLYKKINKANADLKSVDMNISVAIDYTVSNTNADSRESKTTESVRGNLKQARKNGADMDMEMNIVKIKSWSTRGLNPHAMSWAFDSYYTGGVYYEIPTEGGQKGPGIKKTMTPEAVLQQIGYKESIEYPESAVKDCKVIDLNDGKKIELTINGEGMPKEILENILEYMRNTYPSPNLKEAVLTFNEFMCEVLIDKNNIMKSFKLIYDISVTAIGEEGRLINEITMTVNSYNDVTINLPLDLDTYIDQNN